MMRRLGRSVQFSDAPTEVYRHSARNQSVANDVSDNVQPSTTSSQSASDNASQAPSNPQPEPPRQKDGAIDLQGNEPSKSAWVNQNTSGYQPRPRMPRQSPQQMQGSKMRTTLKGISGNRITKKSQRIGYDFSRVQNDQMLASML